VYTLRTFVLDVNALNTVWRSGCGVGRVNEVTKRRVRLILKPRPHQQQSRSNIRLCCHKRQQCRTDSIVKFRPFDKADCCFDIVAVFGNIVAGFAIAERIVQLVAFYNVAWTLLQVWTGLKMVQYSLMYKIRLTERNRIHK